MRFKGLFSWIVVLSIVMGMFSAALNPMTVVQAQSGVTIDPIVEAAFSQMTPEERVGQLFLVTFKGTDAGPDSQIFNLIVNYHIGGVVLLAGNDNFVASPDTVQEARRLITDLQQVKSDMSSVSDSPYSPLFVGISQNGGGYPQDQLFSGLTPLPSQMAIGATWEPELANAAAAVLGQELASMGFNLYFGPSLDVLEQPGLKGTGDLGTRVFGGDPFWAGEMGQAYVSGMHNGSNGRIAVIAKHFPGWGSSDRLPEDEVATVRKSLEQLKQIELAPFFTVTEDTGSEAEVVDGLLVSHIRYQGFQGNIRATTKPISLDPAALEAILALPQFSTWHDNGGLLVSDDLGRQAVRELYAPGGGAFNARLVARDALLAGNDLLYLGNITSSDTSDTFVTTISILEFFSQKYREDTAFAQRVDAAALRVMSAKYKLYGEFRSARVLSLPPLSSGDQDSVQALFDIAHQAVTLISPELQDLDTVLPSPPKQGEYIVFITDTSTIAQCSSCPQKQTLAFDAMQQAILRLYGPAAGGQVYENHLVSYSFAELKALIDNTSDVAYLRDDLVESDWVIISLVESTQGQPQLIRRFFSERQDLLRNKNVIVFSFGAPYYFDSTDISKMTAYYGLYSREEAFIDIAARLLYRELIPTGASPVSISGIGYDLISITSPDPEQVITLSLDNGSGITTPTSTEAATLEPTPVPLFRAGDTIAIRTGVILDHNGNPVPDRTVVRFSQTLTSEGGGILQQVDAFTKDGIASAGFRLESGGLIEIRASSEPAVLSEILQLDVSSDEGAAVTVIPPMPTATVEIPMPEPTIQPRGNGFVTPDGYPRVSSWLINFLFLLGGCWIAYRAGAVIYSPRWGIRWGLCSLLGGLFAYNYLVLGLPGGAHWLKESGLFGVVLITIAGELCGVLIAWWWARKVSASA